MAHKHVYYSEKYFEEHYKDQHVMLPRELSKQVPKTHLMFEEEWRRLGVQQSLRWVHYMIHEPEPHILLFRQPLPKEQNKMKFSWDHLIFFKFNVYVYIR